MLAAFWKSVGGGLSERWLERLFGPAFLFWALGLILWIGPENLPAYWDRLEDLRVVTQSALLIGALLVLAVSDRLMKAFSLPVLRFLEGYWGWPLRRLAAWMAGKRRNSIIRQRYRWSELIQKREAGTLGWRESRELAHLESERRYTPRDPEDAMPTRFGTMLRAAETRPRQRYGLDPVLLWPHLWLHLPDRVREDLSAVRTELDRTADLWLWGLFFLLWGLVKAAVMLFGRGWGWQSAVVWVGLACGWLLVAYEMALQTARSFVDLLLAVFDSQRWVLYEALHGPAPTESGEAEIDVGDALTRFVQRGMTKKPISYVEPKED